MYSNERMLENFRQHKLFEKIQCLNEDGEPYICEYKNESNPFNFDDKAAVIVNAFYSTESNLVVLCAALLQGITFNREAPYYMNFGTVGSIFGHEITHGFDSTGSLFGFNGRCVPIN